MTYALIAINVGVYFLLLPKSYQAASIDDPSLVAYLQVIAAERGLNLAELRALDAGAWKTPGWAGAHIPTLEEVLATVPVGDDADPNLVAALDYLATGACPPVPAMQRESAQDGALWESPDDLRGPPWREFAGAY